jgi:hypothetical protein
MSFMNFLNVEPMPLYINIANLDRISYTSQDPEKAPLQQEKLKRQKYQDIYETHREPFRPFLAFPEGTLAPEATKIIQHLAHITAHKQLMPYSAIVKHLRLCIVITLVKAAHHCLRGSRKKCHQPAPTRNRKQPSEPSLDYGMLYG